MLTFKIVKQLHDSNIGAGLRDYDQLHSAVGSVLTKRDYEENWDPKFEPFVIAHAIIAYHPFVDGNKRTAALVLLTGMAMMNMHLTGEHGGTKALAASIANHARYAAQRGWRKLFEACEHLFEETSVLWYLDHYDKNPDACIEFDDDMRPVGFIGLEK